MKPGLIISNGSYAEVKYDDYYTTANYMIMEVSTCKGKIPYSISFPITPYVYKNKYIMAIFKEGLEGFSYFFYLNSKAIRKIVKRKRLYKRRDKSWLLVYHVEESFEERLVYTHLPCDWNKMLNKQYEKLKHVKKNAKYFASL